MKRFTLALIAKVAIPWLISKAKEAFDDLFSHHPELSVSFNRFITPRYVSKVGYLNELKAC